jgi:VanZ family protein
MHTPAFDSGQEAIQMISTAFWRWPFWTCVIAVLALSLLPNATELPTTGWDKSNHFIAFITLAILGLQAYPTRSGVLFVGLLLFGGLIEILQSFTPYRSAEWADWIADGIGTLVGYGLHGILRRFGPSSFRD